MTRALKLFLESGCRTTSVFLIDCSSALGNHIPHMMPQKLTRRETMRLHFTFDSKNWSRRTGYCIHWVRTCQERVICTEKNGTWVLTSDLMEAFLASALEILAITGGLNTSDMEINLDEVDMNRFVSRLMMKCSFSS